jgi:hypothetical protein
MRFLLIPLACLLASCSTKIYSDSGKPLLSIQSDAKGINYTRSASGAVTFTADTLSNSAPVLAAGKALTPAVAAFSAGMAVSGTTSIVKAVRKPVP